MNGRHTRRDILQSVANDEELYPDVRDTSELLDAVETHDVPGTPPLDTIRLLERHLDLPTVVGRYRVREARVQRGDPEHGEKRSDDHIARYAVELPIAEVDDESAPGVECSRCGGIDALYRYRAHHFISGSESVFCLDCEKVLWRNDWG